MTTPDPAPTDNLTARTMSGVTWTYASTVAGVLMQVGFTAVISRLLDDAAFGLLAMAQLALRFAGQFSRLGLGKAIVQKDELSTEEIRASFTSSVLLGLAFWSATWFLAPHIAGVFDAPGLVPVLRVLALTLVLGGFSVTGGALLRRGMRFKQEAVVAASSYAVAYLGVGIAMAVAGAGVWSLVAAGLTQATIQGAANYALVRHPARPLLSMGPLRRVYSYGSRVSVLGIMEFIGEELDTFAIGRYAGTETLGQYNRAYMLIRLPLYYLVTAFTDVVFPSLSRVQRDRARLRRAYVSAAGIVAGLLLPICAGVAVAAPELSRVVLGPQWGTTAAILPIIAAAVAVHFLTVLCGIVMEAVAELNKKLILQSVYLVVLAALMWAAIGRGNAAYATALAVGGTLRQIAYLLVLQRVIGVRLRDVLRRYAAATITAAAVAASVAAVRTALLAVDAAPPAVLGAEVLTGALALGASARLGLLGETRRDLAERLGHAGVLGRGRVGGLLTRLLGDATGGPAPLRESDLADAATPEERHPPS